MFKKIFEYAGPYKKNMYVATVVVLVSVLMGVLPFVLAYQVIAPLVMGESIEASFIILRVVLVLVCLVLQALFYGWGLNLSHKAAYDTLLRLRTALQKRFEKLPLFRKISFAPARSAVVAAFIIVLSMTISLVGLSNIIKYGYGYMGYLAIFLIIIPLLTVGVRKIRKG